MSTPFCVALAKLVADACTCLELTDLGHAPPVDAAVAMQEHASTMH